MKHWQMQDADYLKRLMESGMTNKQLAFGLIHKMIEKDGQFLENALRKAEK